MYFVSIFTMAMFIFVIVIYMCILQYLYLLKYYVFKLVSV